MFNIVAVLRKSLETADNDPTFSEMKDVTVTTQYPLSYNRVNLTPRPEKKQQRSFRKEECEGSSIV